MIVDIFSFLFCSLLITISGTQLSKQGNKLAALTGMSKAWIGLILMATVTSLPELVTGISAVKVVHAPDLAMGNVLGSCAFNLLILSLLDLFVNKPITCLVRSSHVVAGAFSIVLLAIAGLALSLKPGFSILWISPASLILIFVYIMAMRATFLYEKKHTADPDKPETPEPKDISAIRKAWLTYALHAALVVIAALFLPYFGERIAHQYGLSDTFFGTVFLAVATSLPEIVVSVSALRLGAPDLAIGNLFGSNVFNLAILGISDVLFTEAPLYDSVSPDHLLSIFGSIMMTAIVAIGLVVRPERKRWQLSLDSWIILGIYMLMLVVMN